MGKVRTRTVEGSCRLCQKRRVICDLQRPQCSRYLSSGHECEYVRPRWYNDTVAQSHFEGQKIPKTPSNQAACIISQQQFSSGTEKTMSILRYIAAQLIAYFQYDVIGRFRLPSCQLQIHQHLLVNDPALQHSALAIASAHHALSIPQTSELMTRIKMAAWHCAISCFHEQLAADTSTPAGSSTGDNKTVMNLLRGQCVVLYP
jgi:Fungal Zn(2)-Cys(6) binuclear cluster domain.